MSDNRGLLIIGDDAILTGEVKNCREIDVHGYVQGTLDAGRIVVHPEGRLFGTVRAETADVLGEVQGDIRIQQLISIREFGVRRRQRQIRPPLDGGRRRADGKRA